MQQAHILISGFVQGVGFRHFVRRNAQRLGLKGWVRNTRDNRVEVLLQGLKESIQQLIKLCKKGPEIAEVEKVEVVIEEAAKKFDTFKITL